MFPWSLIIETITVVLRAWPLSATHDFGNLTSNPRSMHGVPAFRGARVPVQNLFDYLEGGETLEDFLSGFPTVSRGLALEALEEVRELLMANC
jgi:uncharacterized protein (DUF433 family)